ncbi:MAG: hypothetical protein KDA25_10685, partial [Phycisphaerales bacterium]|nr:hypothetical protein [Phycisphaerales bacterium]
MVPTEYLDTPIPPDVLGSHPTLSSTHELWDSPGGQLVLVEVGYEAAGDIAALLAAPPDPAAAPPDSFVPLDRITDHFNLSPTARGAVNHAFGLVSGMTPVIAVDQSLLLFG